MQVINAFTTPTDDRRQLNPSGTCCCCLLLMMMAEYSGSCRHLCATTTTTTTTRPFLALYHFLVSFVRCLFLPTFCPEHASRTAPVITAPSRAAAICPRPRGEIVPPHGTHQRSSWTTRDCARSRDQAISSRRTAASVVHLASWKNNGSMAIKPRARTRCGCMPSSWP